MELFQGQFLVMAKRGLGWSVVPRKDENLLLNALLRRSLKDDTLAMDRSCACESSTSFSSDGVISKLLESLRSQLSVWQLQAPAHPHSVAADAMDGNPSCSWSWSVHSLESSPTAICTSPSVLDDAQGSQLDSSGVGRDKKLELNDWNGLLGSQTYGGGGLLRSLTNSIVVASASTGVARLMRFWGRPLLWTAAVFLKRRCGERDWPGVVERDRAGEGLRELGALRLVSRRCWCCWCWWWLRRSSSRRRWSPVAAVVCVMSTCVPSSYVVTSLLVRYGQCSQWDVVFVSFLCILTLL